MKILKVKCLAPTRLDNYLMQQYPALNPGRLNKALRENKIKLNGKKQPLATRVQNGDVIRVYLLDDQLGLTSQEGPEFLQARAPAEFIYENDDLIVANKPAGIPVDGDEADTLLWTAPRTTPCSTVLCSTSTSRASTRRTTCTPRRCATGWTPAPAALCCWQRLRRRKNFW